MKGVDKVVGVSKQVRYAMRGWKHRTLTVRNEGKMHGGIVYGEKAVYEMRGVGTSVYR